MIKKSFCFILIVTLIDQLSKIYIKTHFNLGEKKNILSFFNIYFVENPGIGYGIKIVHGYHGQILISILRFIFIFIGIVYYIHHIKNVKNYYFIISFILILSGSIGNFLDNLLYGLIFDKGMIFNKIWIPYYGISKLNFKGYSYFMTGCVVDFLHLSIIPNINKYIPLLFCKKIHFFDPIFNFSDLLIFFGTLLMFVFKKKINFF